MDSRFDGEISKIRGAANKDYTVASASNFNLDSYKKNKRLQDIISRTDYKYFKGRNNNVIMKTKNEIIFEKIEKLLSEKTGIYAHNRLVNSGISKQNMCARLGDEYKLRLMLQHDNLDIDARDQLVRQLMICCVTFLTCIYVSDGQKHAM